MSTDVGNPHFFDEFLDDYFAECEEHLTVVRRNLLALEPLVNQPTVDRLLLDELLRSFHSLKGLSGMVGVKEAEQLAHYMESYLRDLRSQQVVLTGEGMDALIGGTKMLEGVIAARRASNYPPDIASALQQLAGVVKSEDLSFSEPEPSPPPPSVGAVQEPPPPQDVAEPPTTGSKPATEDSEVQIALKPEESERLATALQSGGRAWRFEFAPVPALAERGVNVNSVRARLQAIGSLIHAAPRVKPGGGIVFDFVVASNADQTAFAGWASDGLLWAPFKTQESQLTPDTRSTGETPAPSDPGSKGETPVLPQRVRKQKSAQKTQKSAVKTQKSAPDTPSADSRGGAPVPAPPVPAPSVPAPPVPAPDTRSTGETPVLPPPAPDAIRRSASSSPPPSAAPAPANIVRVDLARLDELMRMVGELVISRARLEDNLARLEETVPANQLRPLRETNQAMERQLRQLRQGVMRVRLVPVGEIFARMQFVVRDLARESQKKVILELSGQETEIDKFVVERMMDPLLHLVRNAVSHGIESEEERVRQGKPPEGKIALRAIAAGEMVALEIEDDGRGVDAERVVERARALGLLGADTFGQDLSPIGRQIFGSTPPGKRAITSSLSLQARGNTPVAGADSQEGQGGIDSATLLDILCAPGFSTREQADLTSGRGVGMAIVKNAVLELGGTLTLETQPGTGSRFRIQLPLTLAIADAAIVSVAGQTFAVPQSSVREVIEVQSTACTRLENSEIISYRGGVLPIIRLARLFGLSEAEHRGDAAPRKVGLGVRSPENTGRNSEPFAPAEHQRTSPPEPNTAPARFYAFVVGSGLSAVGIAVDGILGLREIVVRPLTDPLVIVPGIAGATELGDGRVVLILDTAALTIF